MAYSRFNYLTPSGLVEFIHTMSGVTDDAQAAKFISDAERMVDAYAGPGPKFYGEFTLQCTAAVSGTTLPSSFWGTRRPNYWAKGGHYVTVVDVPGDPTHATIGQSRLIVASQDDQVTLASAFSTTVPSGSTFRTEQRSAFPRVWDSDPLGSPKLPHLLDQAVAWQVEYGILFGSEEHGLSDSDVVTDSDSDVASRTYASGYSESRASGPSAKAGLSVWVAPKVRAIMRSIMNAAGRLGSW